MASKTKASDKQSGGWGWLFWLIVLGGGYYLIGQEPYRAQRDALIARITGGSVAQAKEFIQNSLRPNAEVNDSKAAVAIGGKSAPQGAPAGNVVSNKDTRDRLTETDRKQLDSLLGSLK